MEQKITSHLTKGLLLSLILIAISVATTIFIKDLQQQQKFGWVTYAIVIGGIAFCGFQYAKEMDGNVTFGNVFAHGFKVTAVVTSIFIVYTVLSLTVLFPEMKEKALEMAREQMESQGKLSEEQIDGAIEITRKGFLVFAIGGSLIGFLFMGALGAVLGAVIAKKNPNPTPFTQG
jgi:NAD/NADP transhydrogenase beta subunit